MTVPKLSKKAREAKSKADKAYTEQKWKKALEAYQELAQELANDPRVLQRVGDLHRRLGNDGEAAEQFKKVASIYVDQGFWAKAIAINKMILEINPTDLSIQQKLAQMYSKQDALSRTDPGPPIRQVENRAAISISGGEPRTMDTPQSTLDLMLGGYVDLSDSDTETLGKPVPSHTSIPLFSEMGPEELAAVLQRLTVRHFPPESLVCEEGDLGRSMYILSEGVVEVFTKNDAGEKLALGKLSGGDFFGEFGLLTNGRRNASVQAKTNVELLEITATDFQAIASKYPRIWKVLEDYLRDRLLKNILIKSPVFQVLTDDEKEKLIGFLHAKKASAGETIMPQDTSGDEMFFVKSGTVAVFIVRQGQKKIVVGELGPGDYFGEVAMLTGKPRTATVVAKTDCELFSLVRQDAAKVLKENREVLVRLKNKMNERMGDTQAAYQSYMEARTTLDLV